MFIPDQRKNRERFDKDKIYFHSSFILYSEPGFPPCSAGSRRGSPLPSGGGSGKTHGLSRSNRRNHPPSQGPISRRRRQDHHGSSKRGGPEVKAPGLRPNRPQQQNSYHPASNQ